MIKRSLTISTNPTTKSNTQPVQSRRANSTSIQKHNKSLSVTQSTGSLSNINLSHSNLPSTISEQSDNSSNGNALSSTLVTEWIKALNTFDKGNLQHALDAFNDIEPKNSKINYNIASIYATLGEYDIAISYFKLAIENDNYMAISYFQIGVCRFLSGLYKKAASSFNTALKLLRGNSVVNYQQLGLEYKLYSCEIMYNRALSYIYSGQMTVGIYDLGFAVKEKRYIAEHGILDEALRHFSKSNDFVKTDNVDIRNMLKLPENFDTKAQRFSILGPPRAEYYNSEKQNHGSSPLSGKSSSEEPVSEPLSKEKIETSSEKMVYSLFSVPQGALFRLTETKVQSILNDKYIGAVIMGMPYPQPSVLQPEFGEKSALRSKGSLSKFETSPGTLQSTTHSHNNSTDSNQQACGEMVKKHTSKSSSGSSLTMPLKQPKKMPSLPRLPATAGTKDTISGHNSNQSSVSSNHQTDGEPFQKYPNPTAPQMKTPGLKEFDSYFNSIADPQLSASQTHQQSSHQHMESFEQNFQYSQQQHYHQHHQKLQTTPPLHIKTPPSVSNNACLFNKHNASLPSPPIEESGHHVDPAIKVKIRFAMETRVTIVRPGISYSDFKKRVRQKLNTSASSTSKNSTNNSYHNELNDDCDDEDSNHHASDGGITDRLFLRIKDEDGDLVLLGDQEDLDVALEEAVANSQVNSGSNPKNSAIKLTVYCEVMASAQNQGGVQFL